MSRRRGFTLIELLVVIAIIAVLIALLLPAVQAAREAARRGQCINNMKQLALACMNYESTNKCLPGRTYPILNYNYSGFSWMVSVLPYAEARPLFDSVNFSWPHWDAPNYTVAGVSTASLHCPTDVDAADREDMDSGWYGNPPGYKQAFSSYAASNGTWWSPTTSYKKGSNGTMFYSSSVKMADVRDGTSQTFLIGERCRSILDPSISIYYMWWNSGYWSDGGFDTSYPINAHKKLTGLLGVCGWIPLEAAASLHPGGANFAFTDGSVRFVKETIDCWKVDQTSPCDPVGIGFVSGIGYTMGTAQPGVYQKLTTRKNNDVLSASDY